MKTRICPRCQQEKPASHDYFVKVPRNILNGFFGCCKTCKQKADREYRARNPEKIKQTVKAYRENNPEFIKEIKHRHYIENRDKYLSRSRAWKEAHPGVNARQARESYERRKDIVIRRQAEKVRADPKLKLTKNLVSSMRQSLKDGKGGRHWESLVGYTHKDLIGHLEVLFQEGMSWDNYGRACGQDRWWSIDHIRPIVTFDYTSPTDQDFKDCWALSNLQPLWFLDNLAKRSIDGSFFKRARP